MATSEKRQERQRVARRWRQFRMENGFSQEELAELLVTSTKLVARVELGLQSPGWAAADNFEQLEKKFATKA